MSNPYDDIFGNRSEKKGPPEKERPSFRLPPDDYPENEKEPLDEILELIGAFQKQAEQFSVLLTRTRAIDYKVEAPLLGKFIVLDDPHDQGNLSRERDYYKKRQQDFRNIIVPMKALAQLHLKAVKKFSLDIDEHYYSIEKEAAEVKSDINNAVDGLNLQRKILADASEDLFILEKAMEQTEKRIRKYIDAGGKNNISASEAALLARKRIALTNGSEHQFDYPFFKLNLLDKAAMTLGVFMKETTSQYLRKLSDAMNA